MTTNSTGVSRGRLLYRARKGDADAKEQLRNDKRADAASAVQPRSQPDNAGPGAA